MEFVSRRDAAFLKGSKIGGVLRAYFTFSTYMEFVKWAKKSPPSVSTGENFGRSLAGSFLLKVFWEFLQPQFSCNAPSIIFAHDVEIFLVAFFAQRHTVFVKDNRTPLERGNFSFLLFRQRFANSPRVKFQVFHNTFSFHFL